jgi:hypothetical protein
MTMQRGSEASVDIPVDGLSAQEQFHNPDPNKIVAREKVTVSAGSFLATHYRNSSADGTSDVWVSDEAPPLGIVKIQTTPAPGTNDAAGRPAQAVSMELNARGNDATPSLVASAPKPSRTGATTAGAPDKGAPSQGSKAKGTMRLPR